MRWSLTVASVLLWLSSIASGQQKNPHADDPISVVVEPVQFPPRTGTFYPVICTITNRTKGLWEGSLRLRQIEELPTDFEIVIPDLAVGTTPLEFRVTLPPIVPNLQNQQTELRAACIDRGGKVTELPNVQLISHTWNVRTLTFGICIPDGVQKIPADVEPLAKPLQLFDNGSMLTSDGRTIRVALPNAVARDLSENGLDYFRFDGLFLSQFAVEQIRSRQFSAITAWVRGGGTLGAILPETLDLEHLELMNQLLGGSGTTLRVDPGGKLVAEPALESPLVYPFGLGQVAVFPSGYLIGKREDPEELTRIYDTNMERLNRQLLLSQGVQRGSRPVATREVVSPVQFIDVEGLFWEILRPRNMGVIPIQFLILALVAYVILIGPGDYYVLGWLKARRFTWIVFPLVTLCFSWGMLRITNAVMGSNDQIRKIRIVDLDDSGTALRENEVSLLMFSTPKHETLSIANGFSTRMQSAPSGYNAQGWDSRRWGRQRPTYVGRLPGRYSVEIDAEQWSPEKYRTTRLGGEKPAPEFPWEKYRGSRLLENDPAGTQLRREFQEEVQKRFGETAYVVLQDGPKQFSLVSWEKVPEHLQQAGAYATQFLLLTPQSESGWLRRVSPQGAESYDDLALLEGGDTGQWGIGICVLEGENFVLYRVLMKKGAVESSVPPSAQSPGGETEEASPGTASPPAVGKVN